MHMRMQDIYENNKATVRTSKRWPNGKVLRSSDLLKLTCMHMREDLLDTSTPLPTLDSVRTTTPQTYIAISATNPVRIGHTRDFKKFAGILSEKEKVSIFSQDNSRGSTGYHIQPQPQTPYTSIVKAALPASDTARPVIRRLRTSALNSSRNRTSKRIRIASDLDKVSTMYLFCTYTSSLGDQNYDVHASKQTQ
ncbi:hypothetical protein BJ508DRAFT_303252 [Ascobolus immersus RN42]|uniref:Uncharacterized protein n=1 Tax=Ascobolus immersus RN42 TaxID=1160509 RepID=A0A3N4IGE9_ASCIM|nr:hypothetical protein BJ508DRAFT_303252 [Ascobolus immersus RN42]